MLYLTSQIIFDVFTANGNCSCAISINVSNFLHSFTRSPTFSPLQEKKMINSDLGLSLT